MNRDGPHILLIGSDEMSSVTARALREAGAIVTNLRDPSDPAIRTALGHRVDSAKILVGGLICFHAVLLLDIVVSMAVLHEPLVDAIYSSTKTIVTVGANPHADDGPGWFKVFSSATMLTGLAFTALFTAGVVNRLIDRRLVAICGRRHVPRRDHVVVVGLGQVGCCACCCASCARR